MLALVAYGAAAAPPKGARRKPLPTPTATPVPYFRAAGSCLRYEPGQYLVLAEVGEGGHVFRLDEDSVIGAPVQTGARLRVLYVETPDGPLARRVLPGPAQVPAEAGGR